MLGTIHVDLSLDVPGTPAGLDFLEALIALLRRSTMADLRIGVTKGASTMTAPMTRHVKMGPATKVKKAAGPPFQIPPGTTSLNIVLDPIDAQGNDVPITPASLPNLAGTLTDDLTPTGIAAGPDSLHYTETIPAGTPPSTQITLKGGLHANDSSFPDLSATDVLITPPAALPADLKILVQIGP
jgi:hypothetical protein